VLPVFPALLSSVEEFALSEFPVLPVLVLPHAAKLAVRTPANRTAALRFQNLLILRHSL